MQYTIVARAGKNLGFLQKVFRFLGLLGFNVLIKARWVGDSDSGRHLAQN